MVEFLNLKRSQWETKKFKIEGSRALKIMAMHTIYLIMG